MTKLERFKSWVFDCDGVLLDSNKVKTEAFRRVAEPYGPSHAQALVDYHVSNGGISRYAKFKTFLKTIVGRREIAAEELQQLLDQYAEFVAGGLRQCALAPGLAELRELTSGCSWVVVSGGDQEELRSLFGERGIADFFDGGIFGSPDTKDEILAREIATSSIVFPAVFVGDSRYDIEAAHRAGLQFIYTRRWSEADYDFAEAMLEVDGIDSLVAQWG